MRTALRNACSVFTVVLVAVFGLPGSAAADPPVPTFYVEVSAYTSAYGIAPQFEYTPIFGGLPPGASLIGNASCSSVYTSGVYGPTESSYGLDPGTYNFVPSSCAADPAFPLQLDGIGGQYNLALVAGSYTVTEATTVTGGAGTEGALVNGIPTPTILTASVLDTSTENVGVAGVTVHFSVQGSNGVWFANVCSAVTADNGSGDYTASCTLSDADAQHLYDSTGVWTASFDGNTDYGGSSYTGQLAGLTSASSAAQALDAILKSNTGVTLEPHYVPPGCDNPDADIQNPDFLQASAGELTCSQLQVLQDLTGVLLGIALIVGSGAQVVLDIASEVAANAAYRALNVGVIQWAKWVVVPNPLNTI